MSLNSLHIPSFPVISLSFPCHFPVISLSFPFISRHEFASYLIGPLARRPGGAYTTIAN